MTIPSPIPTKALKNVLVHSPKLDLKKWPSYTDWVEKIDTCGEYYNPLTHACWGLHTCSCYMAFHPCMSVVTHVCSHTCAWIWIHMLSLTTLGPRGHAVVQLVIPWSSWLFQHSAPPVSTQHITSNSTMQLSVHLTEDISCLRKEDTCESFCIWADTADNACIWPHPPQTITSSTNINANTPFMLCVCVSVSVFVSVFVGVCECVCVCVCVCMCVGRCYIYNKVPKMRTLSATQYTNQLLQNHFSDKNNIYCFLPLPALHTSTA